MLNGFSQIFQINIINNLKGEVQTDKNVDFNQVISLLSGITINASGIDLTLSANTINANSDMRIMATFYNNSMANSGDTLTLLSCRS